MINQNKRWSCKVILTLLLMLSFMSIQAQNKTTVTGVVSDENNEPLIGVAVVEVGTNNGTVTDIEGKYSIMPQSPNAILEFRYIGFHGKTVDLKGRTLVNVELVPDTKVLDEIIVVGYGTQKKTHVTGAVSQVDGAALLTAPASSLSSMLGGRLPGLVSKQSSGQPGADGANLNIRGIGSGGAVLVVVDGVIRESFPDLGPDEIESISILKDASAAVYGVKAAGGVLLITTKRGKIQKPTISINSSLQLSTNATFPKFLNGQEYAYYYNKAQELDGVSENARRFTAEEIDRITNGDPLGIYGNTNWFDEIFRSSAPTYSNSANISGGTEKFKYFINLGAYNQEGIVKRTSYDRYNLRANLDAEITKNLNMSVGISGRRTDQKQPGVSAGVGSYASVFQQAMLSYPYLNAYTPEGVPVGSLNGAGNGNNNPIAARDLSGQSRSRGNQLEVNGNLEYKVPFIEGLSLKLNGRYDKTDLNKKSAVKPYQLAVWNQNSKDYVMQNARHSSKGEVQQWFAETETYTLQPSLNYAKKIGKHDFSVLFLYEYMRRKETSMSSGKRDYPIEDIMDIDQGLEVINDLIKGSHQMDRRAGYVGRINYAFADKYLVELLARYDGTPYLPGKNRWGFFPGASLGWRLSEESFFKDSNLGNIVNNLKLRGSAARLGTDDVLKGKYAYLASVGLSKDPVVLLGDKLYPNLSPSGIANTHLRWQLTDTYNAGFEATLWKGLLGIEFDVFYSLTSRKIEGPSNYPPSMGGYRPGYINWGKHDNRGVELVLSHINHIGDFSYNVRGNVSWARSKVLRTTENADMPDYKRLVGKPLGQIWGFEADGLFQSEEEIARSPLFGPTMVGDIKLKDINGDGRITWDQDMVAIGKSNTPEMMFGFNLGGQYKGFDLDLFFQGAALVDVALAGEYPSGIKDDTFYTRPFYADGNSPRDLVENSWRPDNTNAKYPRLHVESKSNGGKFSSWWVKNASYLRLKSAQLGYTLPSNLTRVAGLEKVRFYMSGSNLFTISGLEGLDPEMPSVNQGYYPQQRIYEFGLNLTF